jgi:hypothetical protein
MINKFKKCALLGISFAIISANTAWPATWYIPNHFPTIGAAVASPLVYAMDEIIITQDLTADTGFNLVPKPLKIKAFSKYKYIREIKSIVYVGCNSELINLCLHRSDGKLLLCPSNGGAGVGPKFTDCAFYGWDLSSNILISFAGGSPGNQPITFTNCVLRGAGIAMYASNGNVSCVGTTVDQMYTGLNISGCIFNYSNGVITTRSSPSTYCIKSTSSGTLNIIGNPSLRTEGTNSVPIILNGGNTATINVNSFNNCPTQWAWTKLSTDNVSALGNAFVSGSNCLYPTSH